MLKKTISYIDYNGTERTENYYFNLSKAELMEMELTTQGGLADTIQNIMDAQDTAAIVKIFKELILKAYGEKSADGKRFIKTNENGNKLCDIFAETEAYSQLFMELATDAKMASEFINGIIPKDLAASANAQGNSNKLRIAEKN